MLTKVFPTRMDPKTRRWLDQIARAHQRRPGDVIRLLIRREAERLANEKHNGQTPGKGELAPVQPVAATEGRNVGMVMLGDTE